MIVKAIGAFWVSMVPSIGRRIEYISSLANDHGQNCDKRNENATTKHMKIWIVKTGERVLLAKRRSAAYSHLIHFVYDNFSAFSVHLNSKHSEPKRWERREKLRIAVAAVAVVVVVAVVIYELFFYVFRTKHSNECVYTWTLCLDDCITKNEKKKIIQKTKRNETK